MLTFEEVLSPSLPYPIETMYHLSDILFFDIETTGFQAEVSSLYLIGCLYYEENSFHLVQWFADDYHSEEELLHEFFALLKTKKHLIHFNGNGFDIPYLLKKCKQYQLNYDFSTCNSIDLYKRLIPYKKVFNLPNYKQKTVEHFLNITREDKYSGGELIEVYGTYMKKKFSYEENTEELSLLLLHNLEDVKGMLQLITLFYYFDIFDKPLLNTSIHIHDKEAITVTSTLDTTLPNPISYSSTFSLYAKENTVTIIIPIVSGELKYFYPNYKDYYYLPKEDTAIHKSVAEYVDKEYRLKAKASTCYIRKTSSFIPGFEQMEVPLFRSNHNDKQGFLELTEDFTKNPDTISTYLLLLFKNEFSR